MTIADGRSLLTPEVRAALPYIATFLLAWFATMALTGWLAERRGREGGLWTVLATFVGPLALIAVLLLPRRERRPDPDVTWRPSPLIGQPEWPALPAEPDPISTRERLLASAFGAVIAAFGAAIAAGAGDLERLAVLAVVGGAAGWLVAYWLAGTVLDADRNRIILTGLGVGVVVLSVNAFLTAVIGIIPAVMRDPSGLEILPLALIGAILYPLVTPLTAPGMLALALGGGIVWAAATHVLILRLRPAGPVAQSPDPSPALEPRSGDARPGAAAVAKLRGPRFLP